MTDDWWHVSDRGVVSGPFAGDEIRAGLRQRRWTRSALVWTPRLEGWRPMRVNFPEARRRPGGRRTAGLRLLATTVSAWAAAALVVALVYADIGDQVPLAWLYVVWTAAGAALVVSGLAAGLAWWRLAGRLVARAPETAAVFRIAAVILTSSAGLLSFVELRQAPAVRDVSRARAQYAYAITTDPSARTVTVEGGIGHGFAEALGAELARVGRPATIEIDSPGGLADEALAAAEAIEARGGVRVVARRQCDSACLVILMSGEQRLADYDMTLGFHAVAPVVETDDRLLEWVVVQEGKKIDAYLRRRGAPAADIAEANRLGPARVHAKPAVELAAQGVLTGLLDGDRPVTVEEARARLAPPTVQAATQTPTA